MDSLVTELREKVLSKIDLSKETTDDELEEFELRNETLSTSGNTPEYTGHIINPFTGKADESRRLSCVRMPDPLDAEVLSNQ